MFYSNIGLDPKNYNTTKYTKIQTLLPTKNLPKNTYKTNRNAILKTKNTNPNKILLVTPTSLATSYKLKSNQVTLIDIQKLPEKQHKKLTKNIDNLHQYNYILFGGTNKTKNNRSISEFTNKTKQNYRTFLTNIL